MPRSYLKFNLTSLFIGTLNIDGFKAKAGFLETFLSEFFIFALYFNRIKTSFFFPSAPAILFCPFSGQGCVGDQRLCSLLKVCPKHCGSYVAFSFLRRYKQSTLVRIFSFCSNGRDVFFTMWRKRKCASAQRSVLMSSLSSFHCLHSEKSTTHTVCFQTAGVQRNDWPFSITTGVQSQFVARHIFYWKDTHGNLLSDGCFPTALCRLKGLEKSTIYPRPRGLGSLFVCESSKA